MVNLEGFSANRLLEPAGMDYQVLSSAETSECVCPDRCDRDHSNE